MGIHLFVGHSEIDGVGKANSIQLQYTENLCTHSTEKSTIIDYQYQHAAKIKIQVMVQSNGVSMAKTIQAPEY